MNYEPLENETYKEFLMRMFVEVKEEQEKNWYEFADWMNATLALNHTESKYRKDYKKFKNEIEEEELTEGLDTATDLSELQIQKDELYKERVKLLNAKRDYNQSLKSVAQTELLFEMISEALSHIEFPKIVHKPQSEILTYKNKVPVTAVLVVSDAHYGKSFCLKGLGGEVINSYSAEIFRDRMWSIIPELAKDLDKMKADELRIVDCGDCIDGILRTGTSLRKLEVGVVDSVMEYSAFMISWLTEVYNRIGNIPVTYSLAGGNHDQLRLLSSKKDFDDENIAKIIHKIIYDGIELIKVRHKAQADEDSYLFVTDYDSSTLINIYGHHILAYHGEGKDLKNDLHFFENFYDTTIDTIITGHLHSGSMDTAGISAYGNKELIRVPSICGSDDFAKKIRKNSSAGCKLFIYNGAVKEWEKTIYLN